MKFAHFSHIWAKPGMTPPSAFMKNCGASFNYAMSSAFDYGFLRPSITSVPDESWDCLRPSLYAIGAGAATHTSRLRIGPMGLHCSALTIPCVWPREDRDCRSGCSAGPHWRLGARFPGNQCGLFPPLSGSTYDLRKSPTLEFVDLHACGIRRDAALLFPTATNFHTDRGPKFSVAAICSGPAFRRCG